MLGQFASRVGGPDVRSLSVSSGWGECWVNLRLEWVERCAKHCHMYILILKRQVLSKCFGLEHECEALGGHWGSLGGSLEVLGDP